MPLVHRIRKSKFIHQFTNKAEDIICPSFYVFAWANNCVFEPKCSYCFLSLTFRYTKDPVVYSSLKVLNEVQKWLTKTTRPSVLNAGELSDSFMEIENKLLADVMDLFETQTKHKLLFVTKNNVIPKEIETNAYNKVYNQTIFSFSVNSQTVADLYETGAPGPFDRIAAAYRLKKQNQHVRIRIDPIIEIKDFKTEYQPVVDVLNDFLKPERITLGSLRFFNNLFYLKKDRDVFKYGVDHKDGDHKLRLPLEKRVEMYKWFKQNLQCKQVAICKETIGCYNLVGMLYQKCNCGI